MYKAEGLNTYTTLAKLHDAPPKLVIQQAMAIDSNNFRITTSHVGNIPINDQTFNDLLATASDNKFRLVEGTLEILDEIQKHKIVSAIICANVEVRDYDEKELRTGYSVLSANLFQDREDETVWRVVDTKHGKNLVQNIQNEYADILASIMARKNEMLSTARYNGMIPANGDYVQYYNKDTGDLRFGFAMAEGDQLKVFDRRSEKVENVFPIQIVACVSCNSIAPEYNLAYKLNTDSREQAMQMHAAADASTTFSSSQAMTAYLDYMRKLYGGTDYFRKLEKAVRNMRNQRQDALPTLSR